MNDLLWMVAQDKRNEFCRQAEQHPARTGQSRAAGGWTFVILAGAALLLVHLLAG